MRCPICGTPCARQRSLDGGWAEKYPNLCLEHNRRRAKEVLLFSEGGDRYAFLPRERIKGGEKAETPYLRHDRHPKNFWLMPGMMISTVLEKHYPLTDEEKATKRRISDLRSEREDLLADAEKIEARIDELETELEFNPDREVHSTWLAGGVDGPRESYCQAIRH